MQEDPAVQNRNGSKGAPNARGRALDAGLARAAKSRDVLRRTVTKAALCEDLDIISRRFDAMYGRRPYDRYLAELTTYMLDTERFDAMAKRIARADLVPDHISTERLREILVDLYDAVADEARFNARLLLVVGDPDRATRRALARLYEIADERVAEVIDYLLDAWGRKMVAPLTSIDLARALVAAAEGTALRGRAERRPAASLQSDFVDAALTLILERTTIPLDDTTLAQRYAGIDGWSRRPGATLERSPRITHHAQC